MTKKIYLIILIAIFSFGVAGFLFLNHKDIKESTIFKQVSKSQNSKFSQFLASINLDWIQTIALPDWQSRYLHSVLSFNNKIWLMGGIKSGNNYKNDIWYSTTGIDWTKATSAAGWSTRSNFGTVIFNNKIWVIGGDNSGNYKNDVWYSDNGINWTEATTNANWSARYGHATIVYNDKIWIMGGLSDGIYKNDIWSSSDGINWAQATSSANWPARYNYAAVVYDNKIWIIGGNVNGIYKNDVWYSDNGINWTEATTNANWSARYGHTAIVYANKIWLMGGKDNEDYKNDIWYSSDGINWSKTSNSAGWSKRLGHATFIFNNKIWVIGGYSPDIANLYCDDIWSSDMALPIIDIKVNNSDSPVSISYNSSAILSWNSTNADSCTASGGWSGIKPTSNTGETIKNILATTTYKLVCANGLTDASDSAVVNVPIICNENWSCANWSTCANNQQTRTCADANKCGTEIKKPSLSQVCDLENSNIPEGALIRATNGIDVYIVKYKNSKQFKRLILSPSVFNSYQHLKWNNIKIVSQVILDSFITSEVVRIDNDTKIYKLYPNGDTGEKRWIKTDAAFSKMGLDWDSIYTINQTDANSYIAGKTEE